MPFPRSPKRRAKKVLLGTSALLAALGFAVASASSASAGVMVYCAQLTAPYSTCPVSFVYQHTQQNSANYNGSGTVSVCQKLTVGGVNQNRTCGNNYTASPVANWGEVRSWAGNNSPNNHTISGIATGS